MYFMCVCSIDDIKPFDVMHFIQSAQCIANDMIGTRVVVIKFHKSLFVSEEVEGGNLLVALRGQALGWEIDGIQIGLWRKIFRFLTIFLPHLARRGGGLRHRPGETKN